MLHHDYKHWCARAYIYEVTVFQPEANFLQTAEQAMCERIVLSGHSSGGVLWHFVGRAVTIQLLL